MRVICVKMYKICTFVLVDTVFFKLSLIDALLSVNTWLIRKSLLLKLVMYLVDILWLVSNARRSKQGARTRPSLVNCWHDRCPLFDHRSASVGHIPL